MTSESDVHGRIDRVAPTIRPDRYGLMWQDWHHLLFMHWPVVPDQLRAALPPGLELDLYEGRAYIAITPFTMSGVRPTGVPSVPFVSRFHETNIRTYVHFCGIDPGVWFFSLDASSTLAVLGARALFRLPYRRARIEMSIEQATPQSPLIIDYHLNRRWPGPTPASCSVRYSPRGPAAPAVLGSLEYFLVERYVLYTVIQGRLYRGRIHHAPWPLQAADVSALDEALLGPSGITRPAEPPLAHYAREVRVEIFRPERVGPGGRSGS